MCHDVDYNTNGDMRVTSLQQALISPSFNLHNTPRDSSRLVLQPQPEAPYPIFPALEVAVQTPLTCFKETPTMRMEIHQLINACPSMRIFV
jgi:hypothetical protein